VGENRGLISSGSVLVNPCYPLSPLTLSLIHRCCRCAIRTGAACLSLRITPTDQSTRTLHFSAGAPDSFRAGPATVIPDSGSPSGVGSSVALTMSVMAIDDLPTVASTSRCMQLLVAKFAHCCPVILITVACYAIPRLKNQCYICF
jgi:hypothetical protein